jgi:hypothetical protein
VFDRLVGWASDKASAIGDALFGGNTSDSRPSADPAASGFVPIETWDSARRKFDEGVTAPLGGR